MSLSKEAAIALAREIKAEEPDLMIVRPIPVTEGGWLIVVKCGLWRWTVSSRDELEAAMEMIFGQPSPETLCEAYADQIKQMAMSKPLRQGMGVDDVMKLTTARALSQGITTKDELMEIASRTIELAM